MELIRLENICKTYYLGEVEVPVLRGISLSIHRGEMVALMGASGSGKSTLMNILGCLDHATAGEYWFDGREMSKLTPNERALVRTEKLGFVFQSFNLLARTSALQNVVMPLDYSLRRQSGRQARRLAQSLLDRVSLTDRVHHVPSQMSGGQQQRVAISRALINNPALVLADEPTGNLDSHTSVEILRMFQQLNTEGITVLLVTHDPQVAAYAHRTIHIVDGMIEGDDTHHSDARKGSVAPPTHTGETALISHADSPYDDGDNRTSRNGISTAVSILPHNTTSAVAVAAANHSESPAATEQVPATQNPPCESDGDTLTKARRWIAIRPLPATWRTALSALRRNKMRAGLSTLGVIIAVAAVIAMTEIGQGSKATLQKSIASMGANTIMIFAGSTNTGGVNKGAGSAVTLTPQDA